MSSKSSTRVEINSTLVELIIGDIVEQDTDAIVNAANSSLLGGGGVDGAIHRAAGPALLKATRALDGCQTGDAKITDGYRLKANHIIHAVGPIYQRNDARVSQLLESAYRRSLELAVEHDIASVAFPAISTGAYGYPMEEAAAIALETTCAFLMEDDSLRLVRFVLFDREALAAYTRSLRLIMDNKRP